MPRAQFAEKQYEQAANVELILGHPHFFPPDQVAEALLGFDFANDPPSPNVWRLLHLRRRLGLLLHPSLMPHWTAIPANRFPPFLVSLFVQYKRPDFSNSPRARHHAYWGGPYYEFRVRTRQHAHLQNLERTVRRHAAVRYASAAFWQAQELFHHQLRGSVLSNSSFVSPLRINGTHKRWTYATAGRRGLANPEPEEIEGEGLNDLLALLAVGSERYSLTEHVRDIAEQLRPNVEELVRGPFPTWLLAYEYPPMTRDWGPRERRKIEDLLLVNYVAGAMDVAWIVVGLEEEERSTLARQARRAP